MYVSVSSRSRTRNKSFRSRLGLKIRSLGLVSEHVSGAESGAERPKIRLSGTERGAGAAEKNWSWSGSGEQSGKSRSGNGAGSCGYRNRLERGAAFLPLTLRLHALVSVSNLFTSL